MFYSYNLLLVISVIFVFPTLSKCIKVRDKSNPYCTVSLDHVLCENKTQGEECGEDFHPDSLSENDEAFILFLHNSLRNKVAVGQETRGLTGAQPPSSNMMKMIWDNELADIAKAEANLCNLKPQCKYCTTVRRFEVGQNMYMSFSNHQKPSPDWDEPIKRWYSDVENFNNKYVMPFVLKSDFGHYSQLLWWNSRAIGCASSRFRHNDWWLRLYVCIYGPTGNLITANMYKIGSHCNGCPNDTKCSKEYKGLCKLTYKVSDIDNAITDSMALFILSPSHFEQTYPKLSEIYKEETGQQSSGRKNKSSSFSLPKSIKILYQMIQNGSIPSELEIVAQRTYQ